MTDLTASLAGVQCHFKLVAASNKDDGSQFSLQT